MVMPDIHDDRAVPLDFERLAPEVVAIEKTQREARLAERNEMDAQGAAAALRGRLERAFNARPVGDTTAGKLNPL
jgi:hypothetical protein